MTQGKHTPRPWVVGNRYSETGVFSADGETLVANTHSSQRNFDRDAQVTEQHANARLIAAAPDLLEALRLALPYVRNDNTASVMRAAITKATGETK